LFEAQSDAERLSKSREERGRVCHISSIPPSLSCAHASYGMCDNNKQPPVDLEEQIERKKTAVRELTLQKDTLSLRLANLHDANDTKV
jgi:hypothetical protein